MENTSAFEWPTDSSRYKLLGLIGKGAFARVYKAQCLDNNAIVAVKVIRLEDISINLEDIRKEVLTLKLCNHENVLTCYCCFNVACTLWIVTPLMNKGSFLRILQHLKREHKLQEGQGFDERIVAYIIKETAQGLKYLHESNVLHRDVKAGNILVDDECNIRLADLGVARVVSREKATTFVGTPCWMAPELMEKKPYDSRADIWSLGITALELFKGIPPYAKYGAMDVFIRVLQNPPGFNSYQDNCPIKPSSAFQAWINSVLKKDIAARYTTDKALSHRWLSMAEEGKEELKKLLREIPDLVGEEDPYISMFEQVDEYVKGTTWDFGGLEPAKQPQEEEEKGDKPWLKSFISASIAENDAN